MIKEVLLNKLNQSIVSVDTESAEAYQKYYPKIEDMLLGVPNDTDILESESLKELLRSLEFRDFSKIDAKFNMFATELRTWVICYTEQAKANERVAKMNSSAQNRFKIFLLILVSIGLVAATFTILDIFRVITFGEIVGSVIGLFDLLFGLAFFAYERKEDMQKTEILSKTDDEIKRIQTELHQKSTGDNSENTAIYVPEGAKVEQESSGKNSSNVVKFK